MNAAGIRGRLTCRWPCSEIASAACLTRFRAAPATRHLPTTCFCLAIHEGSDLRRYRGVGAASQNPDPEPVKGEGPAHKPPRFYWGCQLRFLARTQSPTSAAGAISTRAAV